ncbi:hypothetical protein D9M71_786860 [compost metagenome]
MVGEAKVVVGTEGQQRLAVDDHFRTLRAFQQRAQAVEVLRLAFGKAGIEIERHMQPRVGGGPPHGEPVGASLLANGRPGNTDARRFASKLAPT